MIAVHLLRIRSDYRRMKFSPKRKSSKSRFNFTIIISAKKNNQD